MNKERKREIALKELDKFLTKLRNKYGQSKSIIS